LDSGPHILEEISINILAEIIDTMSYLVSHNTWSWLYEELCWSAMCNHHPHVIRQCLSTSSHLGLDVNWWRAWVLLPISRKATFINKWWNCKWHFCFQFSLSFIPRFT